MTFKYFPDTDSLIIRLREAEGVDAEEISPDVIADFDVNGRVIGFEIHHASEQVDLAEIVMTTIPRLPETVAT